MSAEETPPAGVPRRTLIVSPEPAMRTRLTGLLSSRESVRLKVVAVSPEAAMESLLQSAPDLLILDASPSSTDPLYLIKQFHSAVPNLPILFLSPESDVILAERVLRSGAHGFLMHADLDACLSAAADNLLQEGRYVSEYVMQDILHGMAEPISSDKDMPIELLSDREVMIFRFLGQGHTLREIADELHVNIKTVSTHCNNIRRKLNVLTNKQLAQVSASWLTGLRKHSWK